MAVLYGSRDVYVLKYDNFIGIRFFYGISTSQVFTVFANS